MSLHGGTSDVVQHAVPASSIQSSVPKSTITKRNVKHKKGVSGPNLSKYNVQICYFFILIKLHKTVCKLLLQKSSL